MAVVCDIGDVDIKTRMTQRVPNLLPSQISVTYQPTNCTSATCKSVNVALSGYVHQTIIPFVPLSVTLPPFSTTLRKEYMDSTGNSVCN